MRKRFRAPQIAQETILRCRVCKGITGVVDTYTGSRSVVRRRECKSCGNRFNTRELFFVKTGRKKKKTPITKVYKPRGRPPKPLDVSMPTDMGWYEDDEDTSEILKELGYGGQENYED